MKTILKVNVCWSRRGDKISRSWTGDGQIVGDTNGRMTGQAWSWALYWSLSWYVNI